MTIEVQYQNDDIRLYKKVVNNNATDLNMDSATKGNKLSAVASSTAYFYRPKNANNEKGGFYKNRGWTREDKKTEYANLFSPYWQAKLAETPLEAVLITNATK